MPKPRSLKFRTRELLLGSPLTAKEIAKAIDKSPAWVRMFLNDEIKDPGVTTVQRLYEFLSGRPLFED